MLGPDVLGCRELTAHPSPLDATEGRSTGDEESTGKGRESAFVDPLLLCCDRFAVGLVYFCERLRVTSSNHTAAVLPLSTYHQSKTNIWCSRYMSSYHATSDCSDISCRCWDCWWSGWVGLGWVRLNRWTWETRGAEQQDSVSVASNALFPALRDVMCVMFPRSA